MTLATQLHQLERSQLVRQTDETLMAYIFKHILVQETAYSSLLKGDRQRLHRAVAECIESAEPDRLDENAARLEQHYAASGDHAKTLVYARRAGAFAARLYANAEAIQHYTLALDLLTQNRGSPEDFRNVYLDRGRALQMAGEYERALENYLELETFGQRNGDASLELAGVLERATLHAIPSSVHDPRVGAVLNERALALARAQQDRHAECKALWNLLLIAYFSINPALAVEYGERALALSRELDLRDLRGYILNDMSRPLMSLGPPERVLDMLAEARELFQAQNNLPMLADNLAATAQTNAFYGNYDASAQWEAQAVELSRNINNHWTLAYSRFSSFLLSMHRGQISRVKQMMQELSSLRADTESIIFVFGLRGWLADIQRLLGDFPSALGYSRALAEWAQRTYSLGYAWTVGNLILDLVLNGELDEAKATLDRAHREKLEDFYSFGPVSVARGEGELALALGESEWALRVTADMIAKLNQRGLEFFQADMFALRGRALLQLNRLDEAAAAFTLAHEHGQRLPSRRLLWETFATWADMEEGRGNLPHALALRSQARDYALYIADQWDTPTLRNQFLNQRRVRDLFDAIAAASA